MQIPTALHNCLILIYIYVVVHVYNVYMCKLWNEFLPVNLVVGTCDSFGGWLVSGHPDSSLSVAQARVQPKVWKLPESAALHHYGLQLPDGDCVQSMEQLQCGLFDCCQYLEATDETRYLFCCMNMFSMYVWALTLTCHAGHPERDGGQADAGCAECQGNWNACNTLPVTAQGQRSSPLHQREWWHQMHHGRALPADFVRHDSSPHDAQQDATFHGCLAGPIAHLQCHPSQSNQNGAHTVNWTNTEHVCEWLNSTPWPKPVAGLGNIHHTPDDWMRMSMTWCKFTNGNKVTAAWWLWETLALWLTWWLMSQVKLSRGPSAGRKFRESCRQTTSMWKPSWTHASTGTEPST